MTDNKEPVADTEDPLSVLDELDEGDTLETLADDELRTNESEDGDAEDEADDAEDEAGAENGRGKPSRIQKRIDQLTRQARDAERERDFYRSRDQENQNRIRQLEDWAQTVRPTQEQYEYGQQQGYTQAEVRGFVQQEAEALVAKERFQGTVNTLKEKLQAEVPDALDRLSNPALTMFEPVAVEALSEAKNSVQIAKVLASSDALFDQFRNQSDGYKRAQMIARLDGEITARRASRSQPKPVDVTPKTRGASRAPEKRPEDMSQGEYEVWRRKQGWG